MLKFFEVEKTYHKLTVRLYVDCVAQKADISVVYDRRIVLTGELGINQHIEQFGRGEWLKLDNPDHASRFLSRDYGEHGSFMEATERFYRGKVIVGGLPDHKAA